MTISLGEQIEWVKQREKNCRHFAVAFIEPIPWDHKDADYLAAILKTLSEIQTLKGG